MSNPFYHGNPVTPDQFLDRKREVRCIASRIASQAQSSAVVGGPRSGKTSLLDYLASPDTRVQLYGQDGEKFLFSFLDAQTLGGGFSQAQFWEYALQPLHDRVIALDPEGQLARAYAVCRENDFGTFVLEKLLAQMKQAGWRLVLMLDEFDLLLHHPILNSAEFFGSLRSLASRNRGALGLVIATTRTLGTLNRETQELSRTGSPFFNIFDEISLGPLPDVAVEKLLRRAGGRFTPRDRSFIKRVADGHPYLLQVAASALWEAYEDQDKDARQRRRQAAQDYYDKVGPMLGEGVWRSWPPENRVAFASVSLAHINDMAGQRGLSVPDQYNIPAVRDLLEDAFTASDLRRYCQDRPDFAPLLNTFGQNWGLADMVSAMITYVQKQLLLPELLLDVREINPRQYDRHRPRLASLSLVGQIDFRPELRSLHRHGYVVEDDSIPGGWRVRAEVFVWWLADQVVRASGSRDGFERWLQAQEMDGLMDPVNRRRAYEASRTIGRVFEGGSAALIEEASSS